MDTVEARHPGGIAGEVFARFADESFEPEGEEQLVDLKRGAYPGDDDVDF